MQKKIQSALISVFYKDGLEPLAKRLQSEGITIYSTGGTQQFLEGLGIQCVAVESLTTYPSILGGRVKTLHPVVFGGILGRRYEAQDLEEMKQYKIPEIDLVIVDLYPFEETLKHTSEEKAIIEKIDIGGPSMIRAAAKNFKDVVVIAAKDDYASLEKILAEQKGSTTIEQRKVFAAKAFEVVMHYDIAISNYFNPGHQQSLRYGENPHQQAVFHGDLTQLFDQLNGKELSYNNLVDVDAAVQLIREFTDTTFAIIKHTNVCGIAACSSVKESWDAALAGDPESAFGGVLVTNGTVDKATADAINEIFFEVLIAPSFDADALEVLKSKKNRILLQLKPGTPVLKAPSKSILNGVLEQGADEGNFEKWEEVGGRTSTAAEQEDLRFANLVCKHLKSNAIALVKNKQLVGKGCGQTSRIDALRHAIEKAHQFQFDLKGAVLASDAFFPFNDCVQIAHQEGIEVFIQPGGSVRDKDSIAYCIEHQLAMVMTGMRHFRH
ncbi:MAG: bifunctional phosphoribosylaminoimidazolecarboxamide formyltransferase/IMP cyclohydrolase [Sediminibacterium sp.]|jgi:phosphoribosylaminoimidazolecarboxamide formyltransferase / IMP cyclohydrolase|uniref:bifunctional phosphoribosylaminoimidazolecarboxamide formyltransferase/IMP cyclohydrolase n=1 Tax=Sediminibacterium sp. TaxID=1917865 RepID=UPI002ABBAA7D|nr:bifunctional phosphoribosylaminoimidazolecarboxamide formyltransferase/IMP cyclohydrolase [Sediminibacterium sp.]MDZ4072049.1 bifunctional phosphoribosylaminoimidazolecarboxamide formyltransferase/IMP cyclohydrolase [Sediminibacterium sp.]